MEIERLQPLLGNEIVERLGRRSAGDAAVTYLAALVAPVDRIVAEPRPAAEARPLVVDEGLLNLRARAHDERPILHDRLRDGGPQKIMPACYFIVNLRAPP
jgi:hypothetical protein